MENQLSWPFFLIRLPIALLTSVTRYIAVQTSKTPQWPAEVEPACQVNPNDPIQVSAANNPPDLWLYILANPTQADYHALYQRQEAAQQRLKAKIATRWYNDKKINHLVKASHD